MNDLGLKDEITMTALYDSRFQDELSDASSLFGPDPVPRIYSDLGGSYQRNDLRDDESSLFVGSEMRARSTTPLDFEPDHRNAPLDNLFDDWNGFSAGSAIEDDVNSGVFTGSPIKDSIEEAEDRKSVV